MCVCVCVCVCVYNYYYYYSASKKEETLPFATTWMNLEAISLSGNKPDREKDHTVALTCGI